MTARPLAAAAMLLAVALPAHAAAPVNREVHCLMLSNLFARTAPDPKAREAAGQTRWFYEGRVSAKVPPAALQAAMVAEAKTLDATRVGPEMNDCHATLVASATAVEAAGKKAQGAVDVSKPAVAKPVAK